MKIKILRQAMPDSQPYWQEFYYEWKENQTVAGMLEELNYKDDLTDISGHPARRIQWECSCLQGMCGACAMVINNRPALACETFLRDLGDAAVTLEPLRKFPTVCDLVVDRGIMQENLKKANAYIGEYRETLIKSILPPLGDVFSRGRIDGCAFNQRIPREADPKEYEHMYAAGKCLKCGLCLEVCPNYDGGQIFYGAAFANDCYLIAFRSKSMNNAVRDSYNAHFAKGCSKALSCVDVCPMKIPTLASIAKMNRGKN